MVGIIILFIISYGLPFLFNIAQLVFLFLVMVVILDYVILFSSKMPLDVKREVAEQLSNSDHNNIGLHISNNYPFPIKLRIIDELPQQFQLRNFFLPASMKANEDKEIVYQVRPTERGEYLFRDINIYIKSPLGLVVRRKIIEAEKKVKVLPSFFALRKYELQAYSNQLAEAGNRKIRKIGHSLEFEQIKEYVSGDDIRSLNWKATGRRGGQLMVNNYTDEKSQQVYCIIDKGRVMKMPFDGLTLLDYAINATLILSKVALVKQDKAGLVSFAENIGDFLPADHKAIQMSNILQTLYNQETKFLESDYEKLYALIRTRITQRSLVILFTNFESLSALKRQLPYIRAIARNHLLLVVFFENTSLGELTKSEAQDIEELYVKTIAEKFAYEKRVIVKELQQVGIATILTAPQNLTVNIVNKYLEIKARQAI
ncbi:MAG: DUF58 domain-containing protein [Bacteroidetes bacterium]|nr:DUF58 domain-containing protein [Bacteroidota bacterium]